MRVLIMLVAIVALFVFLAVILPSWPWFRKQHYRDSHRRRGRTIDPSNPPPAVPEPDDDLGPGSRDVPPGSRRDRQRHGKP